MPIKHDLMWMMETTDVETDVINTKYDMINHGPCISIEEDVKLTDDVNHAFNAINSKEIDVSFINRIVPILNSAILWIKFPHTFKLESVAVVAG